MQEIEQDKPPFRSCAKGCIVQESAFENIKNSKSWPLPSCQNAVGCCELYMMVCA